MLFKIVIWISGAVFPLIFGVRPSSNRRFAVLLIGEVGHRFTTDVVQLESLRLEVRDDSADFPIRCCDVAYSPLVVVSLATSSKCLSIREVIVEASNTVLPSSTCEMEVYLALSANNVRREGRVAHHLERSHRDASCSRCFKEEAISETAFVGYGTIEVLHERDAERADRATSPFNSTSELVLGDGHRFKVVLRLLGRGRVWGELNWA